MNIPQSFKDAIANTFYDKTVTRYSTHTVVESGGWARKVGTTVVSGTFQGNVHFEQLDKIKELYGIKEQIDMVVTTATNIPLLEILGYGGRQYEVTRVIPTDSHYLLVAKKWSPHSSTSISV